jgi:hypothetical protein
MVDFETNVELLSVTLKKIIVGCSDLLEGRLYRSLVQCYRISAVLEIYLKY